MTSKTNIKIWKTFNFDESEKIEKEDFLIYDDVYSVIKNKKNLNPEKRKINLVRVTLKELGFDTGGKRPYFYEAAFRMGMKCFPAEAIINFRMKYDNQKFGDSFFVAADPVNSPDNVNSIFIMGHCYLHANSQPKHWLRLFPSDPIGLIGPSTSWVFAI